MVRVATAGTESHNKRNPRIRLLYIKHQGVILPECMVILRKGGMVDEHKYW